MRKIDDSLQTQNDECFYLALVAIASFLWFWFIAKERTAFQWPAIDMASFYVRSQNPQMLLNDFFASASLEPNPRWIFGYFILLISYFFNIDWYQSMYVFKFFLVFAMPALYYQSLYCILKKYLDKYSLLLGRPLLALFVILIIPKQVSGVFAIADWRPFWVQAASQSASQMFALLAIVMREKGGKAGVLSIFIFALSTLKHPAVGFFAIVFYFLSKVACCKNRLALIPLLLGGGIIPLFFLVQVFAPSSVLGTQEFINIYVFFRHPHHYHLQRFASTASVSWQVCFSFMLLWLIIPLVFFIIKKSKEISLTAFLFLLSCILAVFSQWFFIDVFPNKLVATLGPVRFTQYAYWMIVILWTVMLLRFSIVRYFLDKLTVLPLSKLFSRPFILLVLLISFSYSLANMDKPLSNIYNSERVMYDFIASTQPDSVFLSFAHHHNLYIPLVSQRATFSHNAFPFREDFFAEFFERRRMVSNFRRLTPWDFMEISKSRKLDYVIVENAHMDNFDSFQQYVPCFQNARLSIFRVPFLSFKDNFAGGLDFTLNRMPSFVKRFDGLSGHESWGRWSDANVASSVLFELSEPLPNRFTLNLKAVAFGPNIGKILTVIIGANSYSVPISDNRFEVGLNVDLNGERCATIEFIAPEPTSPKELGLSGDNRKLGIGFIQMSLSKFK